MGCGCGHKNKCESLKSVPAELVYDKAYTPLSESTGKFQKYQNFINQDLQDKIEENSQGLSSLSSSVEAVKMENQLLQEQINNLQHVEITDTQIKGMF